MRWTNAALSRRCSNRKTGRTPECGLTSRRSQRRLRLELMDGFGSATMIELSEPLGGRRASAMNHSFHGNHELFENLIRE